MCTIYNASTVNALGARSFVQPIQTETTCMASKPCNVLKSRALQTPSGQMWTWLHFVHILWPQSLHTSIGGREHNLPAPTPPQQTTTMQPLHTQYRPIQNRPFRLNRHKGEKFSIELFSSQLFTA